MCAMQPNGYVGPSRGGFAWQIQSHRPRVCRSFLVAERALAQKVLMKSYYWSTPNYLEAMCACLYPSAKAGPF